ncbi:MAG: hypothetical protein ABIY52_04390 [Gemmatimonadaceae bacterium]
MAGVFFDDAFFTGVFDFALLGFDAEDLLVLALDDFAFDFFEALEELLDFLP